MFTWRFLLTIGAVLALALAACGDGDGDGDVADEVTPTETAQATDDAPGEPADDANEGQTLTVTAVDYSYQDLPDEIPAGTTITVDNQSEAEVHEVLALRIPDDEERTVEELLQLPEEELAQVVEVRGAALAPPGGLSADSPAPPLTLEQPGRYLFACLIPTDAPPDEVLEAAQEFVESGATEGAPAYPETGPPHAANGMFAEVTVTAG